MPMRRLIFTALLAASAATPVIAAERAFPTGGGFDRVSNSTPFDVYIHTGKGASVRAIGTDDTLKRLQIDNRGGELHIGSKSGGWFSGWRRNDERARIDVTVPMVIAVSLA